MRRMILLLEIVLVATVVFASGIGTVAAEPMKNQVVVPASCSDGKTYTFVLNGEGNAGHIIGSKSNIIIARATVIFTDPDTGELIGMDEFGQQGDKSGLEGDLIRCTGQVEVTLFRLGTVIAEFEFDAFVTPRAKSSVQATL